MTCPQCGRPHDAGSKFCRGCGARFDIVAEVAPTCAACQAPLKPGARFCKQCGATSATGTASPTPPPRVEAVIQPPLEPVEPVPVQTVVAPEPLPEPAVAATPVAEASRRPTTAPRPADVTKAGSSRGVVIAASVVFAVVAVGGLVTWVFLRKGDAPANVSTASAPAPAATIAPPVVAPAAPAPSEPAREVATAAVADVAPVTPPPVVAAQVTAPTAEAPPASMAAPARMSPAPVEKPVRAKRAAPAADATAPMQDVALNLVRKGESAFSRQDYSTAIANARAALDVNPGLARAKQLLDEAQRAQQHAMNSISIQ